MKNVQHSKLTVAYCSTRSGAGLKVGDEVKTGTYLGLEGAVGCAMLNHVHFEVVVPDLAAPIDEGGFVNDNAEGKRERNPRFCGVPGEADQQQTQLNGVLSGLGMTADTEVTILSDGADGPRSLPHTHTDTASSALPARSTERSEILRTAQ